MLELSIAFFLKHCIFAAHANLGIHVDGTRGVFGELPRQPPPQNVNWGFGTDGIYGI